MHVPYFLEKTNQLYLRHKERELLLYGNGGLVKLDHY